MEILLTNLTPTHRSPHPNIQPRQPPGSILLRTRLQTLTPSLHIHLPKDILARGQERDGSQRNGWGSA